MREKRPQDLRQEGKRDRGSRSRKVRGPGIRQGGRTRNYPSKSSSQAKEPVDEGSKSSRFRRLIGDVLRCPANPGRAFSFVSQRNFPNRSGALGVRIARATSFEQIGRDSSEALDNCWTSFHIRIPPWKLQHVCHADEGRVCFKQNRL